MVSGSRNRRAQLRDRQPQARVPVPRRGPTAAEPESPFALIGLDMIEARILPQTFDELTVEEAREILERMPEQIPAPR